MARVVGSAVAPDAPGTYVLILRSHRAVSLQIGRWGHLDVAPGYYLYVGSAFGPGGVRARVRRHVLGQGAIHWHIDYLRQVAIPECAWCSVAPQRSEHAWARALEELPALAGVKGFGCSDCRCASHLYFTALKPGLEALREQLPGATPLWP